MSKRRGNIYDRIFKENIEAVFFPVIINRYKWEIASSEILESKLQSTKEREIDFLRKVTTKEGQQFILHLEFQSTNDPEMIYRMQEYHAMLVRKYKLRVHQIVIYLGEKKMTMQTKLPKELTFTEFEPLDMRSIDYNVLLASQIPEEIILAVLGDRKGVDPNVIIESLLNHLFKISKDANALHKFINQLQILSKLRNLEESVIKIADSMPIDIDLTDHKLFKDGLSLGMQKGEQIGMQKGEQKVLENKEAAVLRMLESKKLTIEEIAEFQDVSSEFVKQIAKENSL